MNNGLNTSRKVYQFLWVLLSLLVFRVTLGFDCISSSSMPISKSLSVCVCVLLSLLVLKVGLRFDCISSLSSPIFLL